MNPQYVGQGRHGPASPWGPTRDPQRCSQLPCRAAHTSWEPPVLCCWITSLGALWDQSPGDPRLCWAALRPAHRALPAMGCQWGTQPGLCQHSREQKEELPLFSSEVPLMLLCGSVPSPPSQSLPPHQPLAAVSMVEASSHCCDSRCPRVNQRGYLLGTTETRWWG